MAYKQPLNQKKKSLFGRKPGGTDVGNFLRKINFLKKDPAKGGTGHVPYDQFAQKGTTGTKVTQALDSFSKNLTDKQKKAIADSMKPLGESSENSDYLDKSMDFLNRRSTTNWDALTLGGPAGSETPTDMRTKKQSEKYDAKMAYNKNLSGKARLHYLENNIADHKGPSASKSMLNLGNKYSMGASMRGPLDKQLRGNQHKLPEHLKKAIEAAPEMKGDSPMEASYSKGPKMPTPLNGYESDAQRKAVHASKADGGKGNPNKMKVPLMMPADPKKMLKTKINKLSDQHKDLYDRVIEGYGPSKPGEEKKLYRIEDRLKKQEEKYKKKFGGSPYSMGHKK